MRESHRWRRASSTYLSTWGSYLPFIALFDERICEWKERRAWRILWFLHVLGPEGNWVRIWSIKNSLWLLKERNACNIRELPNLINSCFVLNTFCEERKEPLNEKHIDVAFNYDKEFQPPIDSSYKVSNNETGGKTIRQIYVKYFELKICYAGRLCFDQTLAHLILYFVSPSVTLNISVNRKKLKAKSNELRSTYNLNLKYKIRR